MATGEVSGPLVLLVGGWSDPEAELRSTLAEAGFRTESVGSGNACLRRVRSDDVDAVVSDYALGDLDGVRLVRALRVVYPALPFVLVPARGSEAVAGDAVAAGVSGYVPRAEGPETVVARLRELLARKSRTGDDEGHHRYRHLIAQSPAPINVFDSTGESIWCNDAVVDLLDLDATGDLIGRSIFEFIHPDDRDLARRELEHVTGTKESTGPTSMRLVTDEGEVRYVRVSTAIGDFLGDDVGQAIALDVTDREERERQMERLEQWLRHNIRNEVTVIHGMAAAIEDGRVDDVETATRRIRDHAAHLVEQADHERKILGLLTDPPDPEPTDISAAVRRRVGDLRAAHPDASVDASVAADLLVSAVPQVGDAIWELLENAIEHNDADDRTVRVTATRRDRDRVVVTITDNGPGIPDSELSNLQIDHEINQLDHGTGLGFIFVNWVLKLSDGTVAVRDADPRGSEITLTFPARPDDPDE